MNPRKIVLLTILLTVFSSFAWAKKYEGLAVLGDHKTLKTIVTVVSDSPELTTEDVRRVVKLRLLANGIKPSDRIFTEHHLHVQTSIARIEVGRRVVGYAINVGLSLKKRSIQYKVSELYVGSLFEPEQGEYGGLAIAPEARLKEIINGYLDQFLLDYLESNVK